MRWWWKRATWWPASRHWRQWLFSWEKSTETGCAHGLGWPIEASLEVTKLSGLQSYECLGAIQCLVFAGGKGLQGQHLRRTGELLKQMNFQLSQRPLEVEPMVAIAAVSRRSHLSAQDIQNASLCHVRSACYCLHPWSLGASLEPFERGAVSHWLVVFNDLLEVSNQFCG